MEPATLIAPPIRATLPITLDTIANLAKRRGFVFPVVGDLRRAPLGLRLRAARGRDAAQRQGRVVAVDGATPRRHRRDRLGHPPIPRGLGGLGPSRLVHRPVGGVLQLHTRWRLDKLEDPDLCPNCGQRGYVRRCRASSTSCSRRSWARWRRRRNVVYLRPETAQGIFINYENVRRTSRLKLPFGIAQLGKSFRNEITPGQFVFRTREFEQMEMEFFCRPEESQRFGSSTGWQERFRWYTDLGMSEDGCGCGPTTPTSCPTTRRARRTSNTCFPWGWDELEGVANRTDFDLKAHTERRGEDLSYFDEATGSASSPTSSSPPPAPPGPRSPSSSTPTRGGGRRGERTVVRGSTPVSPRTRWRCCRCRRSPS